MNKKEAALAAADAVEKLMKAVGHSLRLREVGITEAHLAAAAFHAIADTATLFNARPVADPMLVDALSRQIF
jgi:alcohol dehydrogenase class IV